MKRRDFLKKTGVAVGASGGIGAARGAYAGGTDLIKVAVVGCGGRGRGALQQRMTVGDNVKIYALADAFETVAKATETAFNDQGDKRFDVKGRVFWGLDAYKKAIDLCDSVILATPPGFRPIHFAYAIDRDKHVFMEKPCGVDSRAYKMIRAAAKIADEKNLKVVCGFQRHYQNPYVEMVEQIRAGKIGPLKYSCVYWNQGLGRDNSRVPGLTEMQYQVSKWYPMTWLCGDFIVEQHCHNLDVANWVHSLGDPSAPTAHPIKCNAMGGRQTLKFPRVRASGYRYDHFCSEFTYADGTQTFSQCRHQANSWTRVDEVFYGLDGVARAGEIKDYSGKQLWKFEGDSPDPYKNEHAMHSKYIREDIAHNDAWFGANSTMTAVLARTAAYSGKELLWDDVVEKGRDLFPYDLVAEIEANDPAKFWDAVPPILPDSEPPAQPGEGEFIYERSVPVPGEWKWDA